MLEQIALSIISYLVTKTNPTADQIAQIRNWCYDEHIPADILKHIDQTPDSLYDACKQFLVQESIPRWAYNILSPYAESFIKQTDAYYDRLAEEWMAAQILALEMSYGPCYDEAWQQGYQI